MALTVNEMLRFPYTGAKQTYTLPPGRYILRCWGAQGGYRSSSEYGGKGGFSQGIISLDNETKIYIYVGGSGNTGGTNGGFNGGGKRGTYNGGGGATDIRIGQDSLLARVIVAGGGGSDGSTSKAGGAGGGEIAQNTPASNYGTGGYGGHQTGNYGGSNYSTTTQPTGTSSQSDTYSGFGFGGNGVAARSGYGGAGGGGWYGGVGVNPDNGGDDEKGGGGGSGYIWTQETAANYPSGCLLDDSMYLESASMSRGDSNMLIPTNLNGIQTGHSGDGYCIIQVLELYSTGPIIIPTFEKVETEFKSISYRIASLGYDYTEGHFQKVRIRNFNLDTDNTIHFFNSFQ